MQVKMLRAAHVAGAMRSRGEMVSVHPRQAMELIRRGLAEAKSFAQPSQPSQKTQEKAEKTPRGMA